MMMICEGIEMFECEPYKMKVRMHPETLANIVDEWVLMPSDTENNGGYAQSLKEDLEKHGVENFGSGYGQLAFNYDANMDWTNYSWSFGQKSYRRTNKWYNDTDTHKQNVCIVIHFDTDQETSPYTAQAFLTILTDVSTYEAAHWWTWGEEE
tara:strand:+ start:2778 stop:3233 length:456 start_codon:yes stop_codon:yes gene_type:complete